MWFRRDLRLADLPAWFAASAAEYTLPVFIWSPEESGAWAEGGASCWWLHKSLESLNRSLEAAGSRLLILHANDSGAALTALAAAISASTVHCSRMYSPWADARDQRAAKTLQAGGVQLIIHPGSLLLEPEAGAKADGTPYQVYTPFWRGLVSRLHLSARLPAPQTPALPANSPPGLSLSDLNLLPKVNWDAEFPQHWAPGESGAHARLQQFLQQPIQAYATERDHPFTLGTSRLSPHLHFGEISPAEVWRQLTALAGAPEAASEPGILQFAKEIVWREFAHHLLHFFPDLPSEPLRKQFRSFPWREDPARLNAWQRGRTGYPIVDAGMRQLWTTGWMHNRVRMIVASFLVKHLLQPWQHGARWFWDTLVDADLANNSQGWQWSSGCGADAAPYFRIFNPILQGKKFDPAGAYVRRWVPELAGLPNSVIHEPWTADPSTLAQARVKLGDSYPRPIVEHSLARKVAMVAYQRMNSTKT